MASVLCDSVVAAAVEPSLVDTQSIYHYSEVAVALHEMSRKNQTLGKVYSMDICISAELSVNRGFHNHAIKL